MKSHAPAGVRLCQLLAIKLGAQTVADGKQRQEGTHAGLP